jgi:GTP cyclohydrolase I
MLVSQTIEGELVTIQLTRHDELGDEYDENDVRPIHLRDASKVPPSPAGVALPGPVDLEAAERAAEALLRSLGIDTADESLRRTPRRMAMAYAELFSPTPFEPTTFANDEGYDELVIAKSIPMRSVCEHHMLPFSGVAHVGYLPADRVLGLSKLARAVHHFAARPQMQERMTSQIAGWLQSTLKPKGVGVVIEAEHSCMVLRGAAARGSTTVTSAMQGLLRTDPQCRQEFLALTGVTR